MRATWSYTKDKQKLKRIYLSIIPTIRKVARKSGYAIGTHGSLTRDLDLIAVPWVKKCVKPSTLAYRIGKTVAQYHHTLRQTNRAATMKPHGRLAFSIVLGRYAYIDLSIMPVKEAPCPKE